MSVSEAAAAAEVKFLGSIACYVCLALLVYECLITCDQEVQLVLAKTWTGTTWLFILYRYSALICIILTCLPATPQNCRPVETTIQALSAFQFPLLAVFCSIRVHALGGHVLWLSVLVLLLGLVPFGTNMSALLTDKYVEDSGYCYTQSSFPYWLSLRLSIATRVALILSDVLVLVVTFRSTWTTYMHARRMHVKIPLTALVMRDGALHFLVLLAVHISRMLNTLLEGPLVESQVINIIMTIFSEAGVPIVLSRFILNLRQVAYGDVNTLDSSRLGPMSTGGIRFMTSIVGNLGEPLNFSLKSVEFDDDPLRRSTVLPRDAESREIPVDGDCEGWSLGIMDPGTQTNSCIHHSSRCAIRQVL